MATSCNWSWTTLWTSPKTMQPAVATFVSSVQLPIFLQSFDWTFKHSLPPVSMTTMGHHHTSIMITTSINWPSAATTTSVIDNEVMGVASAMVVWWWWGTMVPWQWWQWQHDTNGQCHGNMMAMTMGVIYGSDNRDEEVEVTRVASATVAPHQQWQQANTGDSGTDGWASLLTIMSTTRRGRTCVPTGATRMPVMMTMRWHRTSVLNDCDSMLSYNHSKQKYSPQV